MRWSKVRKLVRESFADAVRDRVDVRVTNADPRGVSFQDRCKQGSITVDGRVVAHIDPHRLRRLTLSLPIGRSDVEPRILLIVEPYREEQKLPAGAQRGTFMEFPDACWEYLHSSLDESLRSADPFISSLAVLNAKVGRQRLRRMSNWVEFRLAAETEAAREHKVVAP
jgi:hypothetical protein